VLDLTISSRSETARNVTACCGKRNFILKRISAAFEGNGSREKNALITYVIFR